MDTAKEIDYTDHAYDMMYLIAEIQKGEAAALIRGKWSDKIDKDELIPVYRCVEFHDPKAEERADDADQYIGYYTPEEAELDDEGIVEDILVHIKEGRTDCEIAVSVNVPEDSPNYERRHYDGIEQDSIEWFSLDLLTGKHDSKTARGCGYGGM